MMGMREEEEKKRKKPRWIGKIVASLALGPLPIFPLV